RARDARPCPGPDREAGRPAAAPRLVPLRRQRPRRAGGHEEGRPGGCRARAERTALPQGQGQEPPLDRPDRPSTAVRRQLARRDSGRRARNRNRITRLAFLWFFLGLAREQVEDGVEDLLRLLQALDFLIDLSKWVPRLRNRGGGRPPALFPGRWSVAG